MARRQVAALAADDVLWEQSPDEEDSSFSDDSFTGRDRLRWAEDYADEHADEHDGTSTQPGEPDEYYKPDNHFIFRTLAWHNATPGQREAMLARMRLPA